ncbi:sensor histidine kinase [Paenibacillus sp. PAMC21692]|uniref:sensor histidine kinase n=1 Tax=Paenibacillus sp. PAMC21692 TaxID=2762320 RepID=UPI00164E16C2|nr:sensor histidine kinase [Paenibacillus sp. PAMC21692]QNK56679.1 sensor histidine kinase [Paenibacillus sp. PAMC21692]
MDKLLARFSPTLGRTVLLAVLLTFIAQAVLLNIGLTYANSIDRSISDKRSENVLSQYQQSSLYLMNDINNLLQLLQTSEFSGYFKSNMPLRDANTEAAERRALLDKIDTLYISPQTVNAIYLIGADENQAALRKRAGSSGFEELGHLSIDSLQFAKLDQLILKDHDQFTSYGKDDFDNVVSYRSKLLGTAEADAVRDFVSHIEDRLILTNGGLNGVLIVIVLADGFFESGLPPDYSDQSIFSILSPDRRLIWTSASNEEARQALSGGQYRFELNGAAYASRIVGLAPFKSQIVYSVQEGKRYFSEHGLFVKMIVLSAAAMVLTLLISWFYMKQVFKPFREISQLLRSQSIGGEKALRVIPEQLGSSRFQAASMRTKLMLVLCTAVMIPTISDGFLYSRFSTQAAQSQMNASLKEIGDFSGMNIKTRVRYLESLMNQLSVSQKFETYLADRSVNTSSPGWDAITISMFPGLNEVSYFVLLDEKGNAIYSSMYSNNKDIFKTESVYLKEQDDLYWISEYVDVFDHKTAAVVKRMPQAQDGGGATYLLLVPKESVFENVGYGLTSTYFSISDENGKTVYQSRLYPEASQQGFLRFAEPIPDSKWSISIAYADYDILTRSREYQSQYILIIFIVFMLSVGGAMAISGILVRPIKALVGTMDAVGNGDLRRQVAFEGRNEIGSIIQSFNKMVRQLEMEIQHNLQMTEENANNKIRENDLIAMKTRAELQMLQAQINPHFLYNTLEAINMRSLRNGNKEVNVMVEALADLFRYSITRGGDEVELEQELGHVRNYARIQQIRFDHSFELELDVPEPLRRAKVPRFILQPIVENAIKHGFEGWEEGGLIRIAVSETNGRLLLDIRDNGIGMSRERLDWLNADMRQGLGEWNGQEGSIGLGNVYHRLRLFYHDDMAMEVSSARMKGTSVRMDLPLAEPIR